MASRNFFNRKRHISPPRPPLKLRACVRRGHLSPNPICSNIQIKINFFPSDIIAPENNMDKEALSRFRFFGTLRGHADWIVFIYYYLKCSQLHKSTHIYKFYIIINIQTRMTTFIKAKLKKSDDQTNIDKYRVAANITKYHITKLIRQLFHIRILKINKFKMSLRTFWSQL